MGEPRRRFSEPSPEQAARNRYAAEVIALEHDIARGAKYQQALIELRDATRAGHCEPALAMRRLTVALYAPHQPPEEPR